MLPTTKSSVAELTACPEVNKAHAAACGFPDLVDAHHQLKIHAALLVKRSARAGHGSPGGDAVAGAALGDLLLLLQLLA